MFREDGAPALIGFSQAALFEPDAPEVVLEQIEAVRQDRSSIRALAATVLARVSGGQARAARRLLDDLEACPDEAILPFLASRVFEVAAATAVRFRADEPALDAGSPTARAVPVAPAIVDPAAPQHIDAVPSGIASLLSWMVPEAVLTRALDAVENAGVADAGKAAVRRWRALSAARRRLVMAAAVAITTVVVLMAVIPAGTSATGTPAHAVGGAPVASP
ncbi:MAG: hypothetical protein ABUL47_01225, partial [Leifsonia sp.]